MIELMEHGSAQALHLCQACGLGRIIMVNRDLLSCLCPREIHPIRTKVNVVLTDLCCSIQSIVVVLLWVCRRLTTPTPPFLWLAGIFWSLDLDKCCYISAWVAGVNPPVGFAILGSCCSVGQFLIQASTVVKEWAHGECVHQAPAVR